MYGFSQGLITQYTDHGELIVVDKSSRICGNCVFLLETFAMYG